MKHPRLTTSLSLGILSIVMLANPRLHGQSAIFVNGQGGPSVGVSVGATAVLDVVGPASQPFALGIGFQSTNIATLYGNLGFDPLDPQSFIFLDGFDPTHPNHAISFLSVTGLFTLFATPYQSGLGPTFHTQALILDPGSLEGAVLTSPIAVSSITPPPTITSASPNYSSVGGTLFINGSNFDPNPTGNVVRIADVVCPILNTGQGWIMASIPNNARSGAVSVTTSAGVGGGDDNNVHTWCAIATTPIQEGTEPAVFTQPTTILGLIGQPGESDLFTIHADAGKEIYAEVYSWDPNTQSITGTINSANFFFDTTVKILRNGTPVASDDDSGPHLNAGIGLDASPAHFIADETGEYQIFVDSYLSLGSGWYLLVCGTRDPVQTNMSIVSMHPNVVRPGDVVQAYVAGVTGGLPSEFTLDVNGVTVPVDQVLPGRIDFTVPFTGVESGAVNVSTSTDATNHLHNDMNAWLTVINPVLTPEAAIAAPLNAGDSVYGQISSMLGPPFYQVGSVAASDLFAFSATAGASYSFEVVAFDDATGRAVTGAFLIPGFLDPEVRIYDGTTMLLSDGSGGPGLNPLIGGTVTPAWTAPVSKTYTVEVSSLFAITQGSYILNIRQVSP